MPRLKSLTAPILVLFLVTGCAATGLFQSAETPEQKYHALLVTFNEYDKAALEIASDKDTPAIVVTNLKRTRGVARSLLDFTKISYETWKASEKELENNPTEDNMDRVLSLATQFSSRLDVTITAVDKLVSVVKSF